MQGRSLGRLTLFFSPTARIGLLVLVLATSFALWKGNRLVRIAAVGNAANWLLNNAFQPRHGQVADEHVFPLAQFAVDAIFAAAFFSLAIYSKRTWLAVMAAFLVLGVANYSSYAGDLRRWQPAFVTASYMWAYGALICLVSGAVHARRLQLRKP